MVSTLMGSARMPNAENVAIRAAKNKTKRLMRHTHPVARRVSQFQQKRVAVQLAKDVGGHRTLFIKLPFIFKCLPSDVCGCNEGV